jgi:YVTN family beta-propeller protein
LALATLVFGLAVAAPAAFARDAFVANAGSDRVVTIDTTIDETVGAPIGVGSNPGGIAITPDGERAYVANFESESVSVIDTVSGAVVTTITVGLHPRGVAITPDGTRAYVANEGSNSVSVIDTASNETVGLPITVGVEPLGVAITPDGTRAYVANWSPGSVSVIDTASNETVGLPIAVGSNPVAVAITPDGKRVYVANRGSDSVSAIDTASGAVATPITVGDAPMGVAVTPDGSRAYVANENSDSVSVIDTESNDVVGGPIAVGEWPRGIAITPDGKRAYVANWFSDNVSVIDTASGALVGDEIPVGDKPLGIAITPDQPPLASLVSAFGTAGHPVRFDASASQDPDGQIARYDWDFGDGQKALDAGPTPTHTYGAPGTYRATVTLTDSEGCSTTFVFTGLTASCNGSSLASATSTVQVTHGDPGAPSNVIRIGKLERNRHKGIARLNVSVPGPGMLQLEGKRVRTVKRALAGATTVALTVRPKPRAMNALKRSGRLEVRVRLTFTPDGGAARALTKKLTLVREG